MLKSQLVRTTIFIGCVIYSTRNERKLEVLLKDNCKDYKHIILTGDLNSKSLEWNNKKVNPCGTILEEHMHNNGLLCINDGLPTRRTSDSFIDLFIVSPKVVPEVFFFVKQWHVRILDLIILEFC